jgi:hypothetical protein
MDSAARHGDDLTVWPDILAPQLCYLAPAEPASALNRLTTRALNSTRALNRFGSMASANLARLGHSKNERLALAVRAHRSNMHGFASKRPSLIAVAQIACRRDTFGEVSWQAHSRARWARRHSATSCRTSGAGANSSHGARVLIIALHPGASNKVQGAHDAR